MDPWFASRLNPEMDSDYERYDDETYIIINKLYNRKLGNLLIYTITKILCRNANPNIGIEKLGVRYIFFFYNGRLFYC